MIEGGRGVGQSGRLIGVGQSGRLIGVGQSGRLIGVGQSGRLIGVGQSGRGRGVVEGWVGWKNCWGGSGVGLVGGKGWQCGWVG